MSDWLIEGVSLGLLLSVLVGPVFFVLLDTTIEHGKRAALITELGIICGVALYIAVFYLGASEFLLPLLKSRYAWLVGGFVFIAFGVIYMMKKPANPNKSRKGKYGLGFLKGFAANGFNPSVAAFWLATVSLALSTYAKEPRNVIYLFAATMTTLFCVDVLKILGADWLRKRLTPNISVWIARIAGGIFVLAGLGFIGRYLLYSVAGSVVF